MATVDEIMASLLNTTTSQGNRRTTRTRQPPTARTPDIPPKSSPAPSNTKSDIKVSQAQQERLESEFSKYRSLNLDGKRTLASAMADELQLTTRKVLSWYNNNAASLLVKNRESSLSFPRVPKTNSETPPPVSGTTGI